MQRRSPHGSRSRDAWFETAARVLSLEYSFYGECRATFQAEIERFAAQYSFVLAALHNVIRERCSAVLAFYRSFRQDSLSDSLRTGTPFARVQNLRLLPHLSTRMRIRCFHCCTAMWDRMAIPRPFARHRRPDAPVVAGRCSYCNSRPAERCQCHCDVDAGISGSAETQGSLETEPRDLVGRFCSHDRARSYFGTKSRGFIRLALFSEALVRAIRVVSGDPRPAYVSGAFCERSGECS